jgi:hypothetical protein
MGMIVQGKSLWNALFTRTQRQVLSLMFGHPERSYYANEVVRIAGVGTGSVQRELSRLSDCGLLTVKRIGNQKHFQANAQSPVYSEIRSIVLKTFGAMDLLRTALYGLDEQIGLALIYGPETRSPSALSHDINMLLVSDALEYTDLVRGLTAVENTIGRTIHPVLFKRSEFEALQAEESEALLGILNQPQLVLIRQQD